MALPHHTKLEVCETRPRYRDGRKPTAVKVYTICDESVYLLVRGVPSIQLGDELRGLVCSWDALPQTAATSQQAAMTSRKPAVLSCSPLPNYPQDDEFTETWLLRCRNIRLSRRIKKKLDDYGFFGGVLHVCYAPEHESPVETKRKLEERRTSVEAKCQEYGYYKKAEASKEDNSDSPLGANTAAEAITPGISTAGPIQSGSPQSDKITYPSQQIQSTESRDPESTIVFPVFPDPSRSQPPLPTDLTVPPPVVSSSLMGQTNILVSRPVSTPSAPLTSLPHVTPPFVPGSENSRHSLTPHSGGCSSSHPASQPRPLTHPASLPRPLTHLPCQPRPLTHLASQPHPLTHPANQPRPLTHPAYLPLPPPPGLQHTPYPLYPSTVRYEDINLSTGESDCTPATQLVGELMTSPETQKTLSESVSLLTAGATSLNSLGGSGTSNVSSRVPGPTGGRSSSSTAIVVREYAPQTQSKPRFVPRQTLKRTRPSADSSEQGDTNAQQTVFKKFRESLPRWVEHSGGSTGSHNPLDGDKGLHHHQTVVDGADDDDDDKLRRQALSLRGEQGPQLPK